MLRTGNKPPPLERDCWNHARLLALGGFLAYFNARAVTIAGKTAQPRSSDFPRWRQKVACARTGKI